MSGPGWWALAVAGWGTALLASVCAAAGLWHHRRGAARVARCAHELRGPLGAIRLGVDLGLRRGGLGPERVRALDLQLARATLALSELATSPGGEGGRDEPCQPVDLDGLARDCAAALAPLGDERGTEVSLGEMAAGSVLGDRGGLAQALSNLIANAIEHGAGPVRVQARRTGDAVRLEVTDHGPGLTRPLDEFLKRGGRPRWAAATAPHGHGLRVAAAVAAAHGGRLLSGSSEQGARLVLELPLSHPAPARTPAARCAD